MTSDTEQYLKTPVATIGDTRVSVWYDPEAEVRVVVTESEWEGVYSRDCYSPNDARRLAQALLEAVTMARMR